ncbi:hypothetical protein NECAME_00568 [Necator americanus]|uniref:ERAP1-like C-terminal domain-containing protein n=1 Tax=Necator americanus TaxID=51031 RepID=W2T2F2_NECAM|nr:hypothetical protein NECAME_00568 [Necator americanus]ETN75157.1 hypothetical protein NECAME_00568 [Necator americanus]
MLQLLSNVMSEKTFQKGLRNYIKKNAYGVSNTEGLWQSLTEACAEDGVKDWEGNNLDVSVLMKEWSYEMSFPILKISSDKHGIVTYEQESCMNTSTIWKIPVIRGDKKEEKLLWFMGKTSNSPDWTPLITAPGIDNVRASSFIRVEYDDFSWEYLLKKVRESENDYRTKGALLDDALFFAKRGVYPWTRVLDLVRDMRLNLSLIQWTPVFSIMDTLYHNFRYHFEFNLIKEYFVENISKTYLLIQRKSPSWEITALGSQMENHMCRMGYSGCLFIAKNIFTEFATKCAYSRHGTGRCVEVAPDYRRTMYCYGLRQKPDRLELVKTMWKYFAEEATYFNRDGDNLLHAMSCTNNTSILTRYIESALSGDLPESIIKYIGENDVTGSSLFDYFKKNPEKVIWGNVNFDYYVDAMIQDWSNEEQLQKVTQFAYSPQHKLLSEEQKKTWDNAVHKVIKNKQWLTENGDSIVKWIEQHVLG